MSVALDPMKSYQIEISYSTWKYRAIKTIWGPVNDFDLGWCPNGQTATVSSWNNLLISLGDMCLRYPKYYQWSRKWLKTVLMCFPTEQNDFFFSTETCDWIFHPNWFINRNIPLNLTVICMTGNPFAKINRRVSLNIMLNNNHMGDLTSLLSVNQGCEFISSRGLCWQHIWHQIIWKKN